ncbi:hypothetical protein D3C81_1822400 [compost metagenome]
MLDDIAAEMADDIERLELCPQLSRPLIDEFCAYVVPCLFHQCVDYIEADSAGRRRLMERSVQLCCWLLVGAAGSHAAKPRTQGRAQKAAAH